MAMLANVLFPIGKLPEETATQIEATGHRTLMMTQQ